MMTCRCLKFVNLRIWMAKRFLHWCDVLKRTTQAGAEVATAWLGVLQSQGLLCSNDYFFIQSAGSKLRSTTSQGAHGRTGLIVIYTR
jgi:hypothetical protein